MMVWLVVCEEVLIGLVILEDGTIDAEKYVQDVLPTALKRGNKMLGNN
jgi:hypothetical protein